PLAATRLKTPGRDPQQRQTPEPSSVLLGKWFISGRSSVEGGPCCKQRLLHEVTVSGLKAIQADFFQACYQLGQCRSRRPESEAQAEPIMRFWDRPRHSSADSDRHPRHHRDSGEERQRNARRHVSRHEVSGARVAEKGTKKDPAPDGPGPKT